MTLEPATHRLGDGVDPGLEPGGLVVRVRRHDDTVVWFQTVPRDDVTAVANDPDRTDDVVGPHRQVAYDNATPGAPAVLEVFDGDTGELIAASVFIALDDTDTT
jgi:hypothetical protein